MKVVVLCCVFSGLPFCDEMMFLVISLSSKTQNILQKIIIRESIIRKNVNVLCISSGSFVYVHNIFILTTTYFASFHVVNDGNILGELLNFNGMNFKLHTFG